MTNSLLKNPLQAESVKVMALAVALALALFSPPVGAAELASKYGGPAREQSQGPEKTVTGYITAYLYGDYRAVEYFDAELNGDRVDNPSGSWKTRLGEGPVVAAIHRNEREKRVSSGYEPFRSGRSSALLPPLYRVLYPGMSFRIVKVGEVQRGNAAVKGTECTKVVTVELSYPDTGYAPAHKGHRVKKGVIDVFLKKWLIKYKVFGYLPLKHGMQLSR